MPMSALGYVLFGVVILLGLACVTRPSNGVLRRWTIRLYGVLIALLALGVYFVGPRLAMAQLESTGVKWSQAASSGAHAMHSVHVRLDGLLFIMAIILLVLASRPPKQ